MGFLSEPTERWGNRWKQEHQLHPTRVRRAAWISLAVHLFLFLTLAIGIPEKPKPQVRLVGIPIHLVGLSGKAGGGSGASARPTRPQPPPKKEEVKKEQTRPKPKPAAVESQTKKEGEKKPTPAKPAKEGRPEPTRRKAPEGERQGASSGADSTRALRSEVPLAGGGSGAMEIGVEGPITAYSYYLMTVRDKIASYWEPPPEAASGSEISAMISFRIDRRGNVQASYIEEPSGTRLFDQAGLRAVTMADPLPPLPQDYDGDWLGIHLRFVYTD